jgi:hypothetical protein
MKHHIKSPPLIVNHDPGRDGRCVQSLGTDSPHRDDMRLLVIPL